MSTESAAPEAGAAAPIRVVIADDHLVVRTGFAALLATQPDFVVVGTAADGEETVRLCREVAPDVVLMDVRMPVTDGIEATRRVVAEAAPRPGGGPRILILTTFDLDQYVYDALSAGASGFLLKDATAERLFEAVRVVAAGEALLAPGVTRRLISEFTRLRPGSGTPGTPGTPRGAAGPGGGAGAGPGPGSHATTGPGGPRPAPNPRLATLTPRETEVLLLVARGLSNPEIAATLVVTDETVKTHVSRILTKLGLRDRTQAVVAAYESGLVVPGAEA
ncbi:response regulator transcription factor [Catenulispora yoronensis]|uniref:Response regulator transcription factor n=1 Tax=Catenulispora yoronensis TaxID=450799 RepID=A0ABN2V3R6_9ACTN